LTKTIDHLTRELALLDPVRPGELEEALFNTDADELLARILAAEAEIDGVMAAAGDDVARRADEAIRCRSGRRPGDGRRRRARTS
jgi:hypothetical protein